MHYTDSLKIERCEVSHCADTMHLSGILATGSVSIYKPPMYTKAFSSSVTL